MIIYNFEAQPRLFYDVADDEQNGKKVDHPVNVPSFPADEL